MGDLVKSAKIPKRTQSRSASKKLTSESQPTIIAEPKATTAALPNTVPGAEPAVVPGTETGSVTDGSETESDWLQSIVSESTVSSDSSHLSFSEVYIDEVERIMGINFESLKRDLELKIENLLELQDVPDLLLDKAYNKVRNSIRTLGYPSDVVNKQTKSTIVSSLLQEINLYFLDKFNIKKDQLLIEQEVPIIWFKYRGKISFAITRSTDMFDGDRSYYFVVECSKSDPLDGLKQCIMYLHRVQRLNPNKNAYGLISNAKSWHLVRLSEEGFRVSKAYELTFPAMKEETKRRPGRIEKKIWKNEYSLMVKVIYSIIHDELSSCIQRSKT